MPIIVQGASSPATVSKPARSRAGGARTVNVTKPEFVRRAVWHNFDVTQNIAADTWTTLDFTTPNTIRQVGDQDYLNAGRILGDDGEWFTIRADITFTPVDGTASYIRFGLNDDVGGFDVFVKPLHPVLLGQGLEDEASLPITTLTIKSVNPQGWLPQVFSDGPITVSRVQTFIVNEVIG